MLKKYVILIIGVKMKNIDIYWTTSYSILKQIFNESIKGMYPNFKFKYNWINYPQIEEYLIRLMLSSTINSSNIHSQLPELIHDVECFFASGLQSGLFTKNNLPRILSNLTNKNTGFRIVEFLPPSLSGVYGNSTLNKIQINQNMQKHSNSPNLTAKEIRRLYMFHEMGHKILNILSNEKVIFDYISTIKNVLKSKGIEINPDTKYIYDGFWMIEECLTQELAEYLTYYSSKKQRPSFKNRQDMGIIISTNHDYYGIFQTPTINLGKTLRGCSKQNSTNNEILLNMIKKALNSNFDLELISEYNQGNAKLYYDLYQTLYNMGIIKTQKYASFGIGQYVNYNILDCLNNISNITKRNIDYRNYPEGGYPIINFGEYTTLKKK